MKSKQAPRNDSPAWTTRDFKRVRGRPKLESPKEQVTLRLDAKVLRAYRASGPGWQSRINATLAKAVGRSKVERKAGK
jgi:uncharacterized protein (DUF4415 family)